LYSDRRDKGTASVLNRTAIPSDRSQEKEPDRRPMENGSEGERRSNRSLAIWNRITDSIAIISGDKTDAKNTFGKRPTVTKTYTAPVNGPVAKIVIPGPTVTPTYSLTLPRGSADMYD